LLIRASQFCDENLTMTGSGCQNVDLGFLQNIPFCPISLSPIIGIFLSKWASRKYRRLKGGQRRAWRWLRRIMQRRICWTADLAGRNSQHGPEHGNGVIPEPAVPGPVLHHFAGDLFGFGDVTISIQTNLIFW